MLRRLIALSLLAATCSALAAVTPASAAPVDLDARLSQSLLHKNKAQRVFLKIAIKANRPPTRKDRAPLNIGLVIDRSGSMQGPRIEAAREAAMMAIDRLGLDDIVSVVSYDNTVEVEVPATRPRDTRDIKRRIAALTPRGSTAIYAGLEASGREVEKFLSDDMINRIILLSDGLANVGPREPADFARLGRKFAGRGITVSAIGLGAGYNEDLMSELARAADGNHAFVEEPADLAAFFDREFGEALSIVAQDITIIIQCRRGVKPIRGLGRDGEVEGERLVYKVRQLPGGAEQVVMAELEVPAGFALTPETLADVSVEYRSADTNVRMKGTKTVIATATEDEKAIESSYDGDVMEDATLLSAREQREAAIKLRDAGRHEEAQRAFKGTADMIGRASELYRFAPSPRLEAEKKANQAAAKPATPAEWNVQRKSLRDLQSNQAGSAKKY